MKAYALKQRAVYGLIFLGLIITEVLIALYLKSGFIRSYGGDILVVILICCFVRMFFINKPKLLALWVFLFSVAVEVAQYFDFVKLLGLENSEFLSILLGRWYSFIDILCYLLGCIIFFVAENLFKKSNKKAH